MDYGKLIELLNEYHHFNSDLIYYGWDKEYDRVYIHSELPEEQKKKLAKAGIDDEGIDEERVYDEWICSKKFGFIKWLVENEKINYKELPYLGEYGQGTTPYESLLMLLSIQDEPIKLLISILK